MCICVLSIPFRIPDTTETEPRFIAERNLSIPFRIPATQTTTTATANFSVSVVLFQFLSGFQAA